MAGAPNGGIKPQNPYQNGPVPIDHGTGNAADWRPDNTPTVSNTMHNNWQKINGNTPIYNQVVQNPVYNGQQPTFNANQTRNMAQNIAGKVQNPWGVNRQQNIDMPNNVPMLQQNRRRGGQSNFGAGVQNALQNFNPEQMKYANEAPAKYDAYGQPMNFMAHRQRDPNAFDFNALTSQPGWSQGTDSQMISNPDHRTMTLPNGMTLNVANAQTGRDNWYGQQQAWLTGQGRDDMNRLNSYSISTPEELQAIMNGQFTNWTPPQGW